MKNTARFTLGEDEYKQHLMDEIASHAKKYKSLNRVDVTMNDGMRIDSRLMFGAIRDQQEKLEKILDKFEEDIAELSELTGEEPLKLYNKLVEIHGIFYTPPMVNV